MSAAVLEQRPQILARAAQGDLESFSQLIDALLGPAYRLAAVVLGPRSGCGLTSRRRRCSDVSNENFRRELNHTFDEMGGSPSPALRDRVRSSIAQAPEARGPFWIATVAACVIAVLVVGVLFVGNPL